MDKLNPTILIVDDRQLEANYHRLLIYRCYSGFVIRTCHSGFMALAELKEKTFDLILISLQMALMDGIETTEEIRRLRFIMPIIGLTHHEITPELKTECLQAGMRTVERKPLPEGNRLLNQLTTWLTPAIQK